MRSARGTASWIPRVSPANLVGLALFAIFVAPALLGSSTLKLLHIGGGDDVSGDPAARKNLGSFIAVPKNSHAYLRSKFPSDKSYFTYNVSRTYETLASQNAEELRETRSYLHAFIEKDLEPWDESGITLEMIRDAENSYDLCDGDMFRFQILDGRLFVYHITQRGAGWYPSVLGAGNLAARGRVPYQMLILLETLRLFPGQVPDLDAVMQVGDFTCINATEANVTGRLPPIPMFGYTTSDEAADLPLPDFSYWGHEHLYLMDPYGNPAFGWDPQREILEAKYGPVPLEARIPRAMWRGRTRDKLYPRRDALRREVVACQAALREQGREDEALLLDLSGEPVVMQDFGDFRYLLHIEPQAWASNIRQKLASGSVVIQPQFKYYEWYSRALESGKHFVVIDPDSATLCDDLARTVGDMNRLIDDKVARDGGTLAPSGTSAPAASPAATAPAATTPTLKAAREGMRSDPALARLLEVPAAGADGELPGPPPPTAPYRWGSDLPPWEIAQEGVRFMDERTRVLDALVYTRDMLRAYAKRLSFKPLKYHKADCYDGARVLDQFGTPYQEDAQLVSWAYPWLNAYTGGCDRPHPPIYDPGLGGGD